MIRESCCLFFVLALCLTFSFTAGAKEIDQALVDLYLAECRDGAQPASVADQRTLGDWQQMNVRSRARYTCSMMALIEGLTVPTRASMANGLTNCLNAPNLTKTRKGGSLRSFKLWDATTICAQEISRQ